MSGIARGASITLAARLAALVIGIASSVVVARALGPAGKGEYALIILIPALFQLAGGLGLDQAVVYLVARRRGEARAITFTLAASSAGLGLLLLGGYAALSLLPPYTRYLEAAAVDPPLVWILIALLPVTLATQSLLSGILALERYRDYNLATLVPPIVNLALLLALVVLLRLGVAGAVAASGGASLIGLAGAGVLFFAAAPAGQVRPLPGLVREALSYGWRAHAASLAWFVHYRADMFLVGYMAGPAALGFYATAVGLAEKLYLAPSAIGTVLFPRVAAAEGSEQRNVTPQASRYALWLTIGLSVLVAALARPVIGGLYGADFLPSVPLLWLLLPGMISLAVGRLVSADLNGRGLPGSVARVNASATALNLVLNLWWLPIWGLAGAAVATSVSYTMTTVLLVQRYRRASGARWAELLLFRRSDWADLSRVGAWLARPAASGDTPAGDQGL